MLLDLKKHVAFYYVGAPSVTYVCSLLKSKGSILKQNCSDTPQASKGECGTGLTCAPGQKSSGGSWVRDPLLSFIVSIATSQRPGRVSRLGSACRGVAPCPPSPAPGAPAQPFPQPQHHQRVQACAKCCNISLLSLQFPGAMTARGALLLL